MCLKLHTKILICTDASTVNFMDHWNSEIHLGNAKHRGIWILPKLSPNEWIHKISYVLVNFFPSVGTRVIASATKNWVSLWRLGQVAKRTLRASRTETLWSAWMQLLLLLSGGISRGRTNTWKCFWIVKEQKLTV